MARIFDGMLRTGLAAREGGRPAGEDGVARGGVVVSDTTARGFVLGRRLDVIQHAAQPVKTR